MFGGGLVQSGGFGSFSKHYGTAAGSLLEAEVVTADGKIRIANACTNSDLFWALKGGGGGTFGVVTRMTLRVHDLPESFAVANFRRDQPGTIKPGGGAVLQQAWDGGTVHQRRQADGRDDAAFLSPLSRQRGAAVAERARL